MQTNVRLDLETVFTGQSCLVLLVPGAPPVALPWASLRAVTISATHDLLLNFEGLCVALVGDETTTRSWFNEIAIHGRFMVPHARNFELLRRLADAVQPASDPAGGVV